MINVPREYDELGRPDGYWIRRRAVDAGIPLLTDLQLARAVIEALRHKKLADAEHAGVRRVRGAEDGGAQVARLAAQTSSVPNRVAIGCVSNRALPPAFVTNRCPHS